MTSIEDLLLRAVDEAPDRVAVRWHERSITYAELDQLVERSATQLRGAGVGAGDRVALLTGNAPSAPVLMFAAWRVGAVAAPVNDRLRSDDLAAALEVVDPCMVVQLHRSGGPSVPIPEAGPTAASAWGVLAADPLGQIADQSADRRPASAPATEPTGTDAALVLTTSGSTGVPKAVVVGHHREVESSATLVDLLHLEPDDVTALAVSVTHAFGLSCLLTALAAASEILLVDSTTGTGPLSDALAGASVVHGSPTLFAGLAPHDRALPDRLRTGFVAGATAPPALIERLDDAGLTALNLYGMTEIGAASSTRPGDSAPLRRSTSGRALPGHELRIVDGELQVRGSHVSPAYFRQPERTAQAYDGEWLRTGDQATLDTEGNLTVTGRLDDLVSIAGFNVSPAEVESCLLEHPDTATAVVVGRPDRRLGNRLVAFVVPRDGTTLEAHHLLGHVRARLAGYKVPYRVEFMDALPRLATGKPDRRELNRLARELDR